MAKQRPVDQTSGHVVVASAAVGWLPAAVVELAVVVAADEVVAVVVADEAVEVVVVVVVELVVTVAAVVTVGEFGVVWTHDLQPLPGPSCRNQTPGKERAHHVVLSYNVIVNK